jgi:2-C-methyl-D-erythritol 2,4-cyclodiphosphate synthase
MTVINGVVRQLPGTVGKAASLQQESHRDGLLEHPHYTRPALFRGQEVPEVLRGGDHGAIERWRQQQSQERTRLRRPDLYARWLEGRAAAGPARLEDWALSMASTGTTMDLRIGNGYDIHRLVLGRPLILGGVLLEHPDGLGLDGHSDADVLVHALMDALLGALSLGDIGRHFPPEDSRWQGADSLELLHKVVALVAERGWRVVNVDAVVIAERPRLKPHIDTMRAAIAAGLGVDPEQVGVKATTNEGLGPEGREEGVACHAVALLARN